MHNLRKTLRSYRTQHAVSTRALAKEIGVSRASLNRFERTSGGISADSLARLLCWLLAKPPRPTRGTR